MSRNRPSSSARRLTRRSREELREFIASRDRAASAQNATSGATNDTETPKAEDPSIQEPKPKCKHHHLPVRLFPFSYLLPPRKLIMCLQNRLYFARDNKFERRALGHERNVSKRIDDKILEMTTVLDAQHRRIMHAVNRHATQLRNENQDLTKRLQRLERKYRMLETRQDDLLDELFQTCSEKSRERLERIRAAHAQRLNDVATEGFIMT
ncbi:hypothetical protein ACHAP5_011524 [Fusarium lateritium]